MKKLLVILCLIALSGCTTTDNKEIESMYIVKYGYYVSLADYLTAYKIDFVNEEFLKCEMDYEEFYEERNNDLLSYNYELVSKLDGEKIDAFNADMNRYKVNKLKSNYENNEVLDGGGWQIIIVYVDAETVISNGRNAFPNNWNKISESVEKLVGDDIMGSSY